MKIDITITNEDGQSATLSAAFELKFPAPVITSVSPSSGPMTGGTPVMIAGENFRPGAVVLFGGRPAVNVEVSPDGKMISAVTPPVI